MKHDEHLLTRALDLVRACSGLASAMPLDTGQAVCLSAPSYTYEPHCLMTWATQVAAMDEMAGFEVTR